MAKVKYYLDNGNVLLSYYVKEGDICRLSLKEKIDVKHWDKKKYRAKSTYKLYNTLNRLLDDMDLYVKNLRIEYMIKGLYFDGKVLKQELKNRLYGNSSGLFSGYAKDIFLKDKVGTVKQDTVRTYGSCIDIINKYNPGLTFEQINRTVCLRLEKGMINDKYSKNYINRVFKVFANIIKNAYIDGIHSNKYYMTDGFVPGTEAVDNMYLTIDDLDLIYNNLDTLSDRDRNAAVIFLRGCYTGQRFQSYIQITNTMVYEFNGVSMISLKHGKTGITVSIPLSEKMKAVMDIPAYPISRQKLSTYVKAVCKQVGIVKWNEVATHTARRTFATNMVLAGVDISKIMKITGHNTEQEFRKYVKIDGVQSAVSVIDQVNQVFGVI
jgi:integrase